MLIFYFYCCLFTVLITSSQCDMYKNKRMPSGWTQETLISTFKQILFAKWCMEPTQKGNPMKYKPYPMPEDYIPFPCWDLWILIGAPAGDQCNLILKCEFIAPVPVCMVAANGANTDEVPIAVTALTASTQGQRFTSRW